MNEDWNAGQLHQSSVRISCSPSGRLTNDKWVKTPCIWVFMSTCVLAIETLGNQWVRGCWGVCCITASTSSYTHACMCISTGHGSLIGPPSRLTTACLSVSWSHCSHHRLDAECCSSRMVGRSHLGSLLLGTLHEYGLTAEKACCSCYKKYCSLSHAM